MATLEEMVLSAKDKKMVYGYGKVYRPCQGAGRLLE